MDGKGREGMVSVDWKGSKLYVSTADITDLLNSNFVDDSVEGIISQVNGVQAIAAMFNNRNEGSSFTATIASDDFQEFFKEITGKDYDAYTAGMTQEEKDKINYNAFVLYAASAAEQALNNEAYLSSLSTVEGSVQYLMSDYLGTIQKVQQKQSVTDAEIAKAASIYSVNMIGRDNYVNSIQALWTEACEKYTASVLVASDGSGYELLKQEYPDQYEAIWACKNGQETDYYYTSGNALADAKGFISSMSMITDNLDDPSKVDKLLTDGFDADLINSLNAALGLSG